MAGRRSFLGSYRPAAQSLADADFRPTASLENLRLRAGLLKRVRGFFGGRGFLEVETPLMSGDTVVDRHLDPFVVRSVEDRGERESERRLWLQTSPEFCMKRLLAAGAEAIYQIARAFRSDERGPMHNPEFTLVEWYRAGDGPEEGMQLLSDLCEALLERGPAERITYRDAFRRHAGIDALAASLSELRSAAEQQDIAFPETLSPSDRDGWLDLLLVEKVQPHLGAQRPAILYDYPATQAALARIRPEDPPVAERFELFVDGIELANGYHELLDPDELRGRITETNLRRQLDGKHPLPSESRLLAAMEAGLPPSVGVALGFDRVVMLAAGAKTIDEVLAFPIERA